MKRLIQLGPATMPIALGVLFGLPLNTHAQLKFTPEEIGQTVNGFQDDFTGPSRDPSWVPLPAELDLYEQVDGVLRVTVRGDGDTHLIYKDPSYSDKVQEVLARIRINLFGEGDPSRCGIAVAVNASSNRGINLHFRDTGLIEVGLHGLLGRYIRLLDDQVSWGPRRETLLLDWSNAVWYWLRLRQTGPSTNSANNVHAKVWLADGSVPEPDWQMRWRRDGKTGFAGLAGASNGGISEFEVDYILIKADGLPRITARLDAFPAPFFLSVKQHPADARVDAGQSAMFAVNVASSSAASFQWQRAGPGSADFSDIAGANAASYTAPSVTRLDDGAQFRCVAWIPGAKIISNGAHLTLEGPPTFISARARLNLTLDGVLVTFSEPVTASSATNAAHYSINGSRIIQAKLLPGETQVLLTVTPFDPAGSYNLTVNGISDLTGNAIVPNSQIAVNLALRLPTEFGQGVNGFQDDFSTVARDARWVAVPADKDTYVQTNGLLRVSATPGGTVPSHLLFISNYHDGAQEILARVRVVRLIQLEGVPMSGIAVATDPSSSEGINLVFRNPGQDFETDRHLNLIDNGRPPVGPPGLNTIWENDAWYWLRLRQTNILAITGPNIYAKVWPADGLVDEPPEWQVRWARNDRVGFAGIANSNGRIYEFDVDYILIKADGLPRIRAGFATFPPTAGPGTAPPSSNPLKIGFSRSGSNLMLTWAGGGTLESAARIEGPWSAIVGASSPRSETISGAAKFYRARP